MITIKFIYDKDNQIKGFECNGHAGYAEAGQDIICASVSALVFNMINSVEAFTEDDFSGEADEESGHVYFEFTDIPSEKGLLLLKSLELGLRNIEEDCSQSNITNDYILIEK